VGVLALAAALRRLAHRLEPEPARTLTVVVQADTGAVIEQKLLRLKRTRGGGPLGFA
jgi:hypothetical protein